MTLVIVANLSDRIYMCSDSRVSKKSEGSVGIVSDSVLKIFPLNDEEKIYIACIGNLSAVKHIITNLQDFTRDNNDIRSFRRNIKGEIQIIIGDYLLKEGVKYEDVRFSMVFAGFNQGKPRKLKSEKLQSHIKYCQEQRQQRFEDKYKSSEIEKFSQQELMEFVRDMQENRGSMKGVLFDGLQETATKNNNNVEIFETSSPDQHVFVVDIDATKKGESAVQIDDVEWGELVVRGGGHKTEMLPKDILCWLDYGYAAGNPNKDIIPIVSYIKDNFSSVIEGVITSFVLHENEFYIPTGKFIRQDSKRLESPEVLFHTKVIDGKLSYFDKDKWVRMVSVKEFQNSADAQLYL